MSYVDFTFDSSPFTTNEANHDMTMDEFCDLLLPEPTFYKILPLLTPYLTTTDIISCASVNTTLNKLFDSFYFYPDFQKLSYIHDALFMFNKFLFHLPKIRPSNLSKIHTLDISGIQESLYDQVNPNFFRLLVQYCHQLTHLNVANSDFFLHKSLPKNLWSLPQLKVLNVSNCSQISDDMLVSIARGCRGLTRVTLDHLPRHKGKGLAALAAECDKLSYVSARFNTAMEDGALTALAKFRHIRLASLDLTGCKKLTSVGFEVLARYCAHITTLSLSQTVCRLPELRKFTCISLRTRVLDISGCKNLVNQETADWIWNSRFKELKELQMDTRIANEIVNVSHVKLIDDATTVRQVTTLRLMDLPERTAMTYLYELLTVFPYLDHVSFRRAYFETDFMLGTYRTPSPEKEEYITDISLERFNRSQTGVHVAMIKEQDHDLLQW